MRARAIRDYPHCHDVLVVDDVFETREAIVAMLEAKGFTARGAADGPDALDMLQGGLRPCVVILDVRMPMMNGWEVWDRMKAHAELALTPVVLLSADAADDADDARAKSVGIRDFLRKPIDGWRLVSAVEKHCERLSDPPIT